MIKLSNGEAIRGSDGISPTLDERGVLTLTIRRPERHGALRMVDQQALAEALEAAASSDPTEVRAVLVASEGPSFCSGADLGDTRGGRPVVGHMTRDLRRQAHRLILAVHDCPRPVVMAVQGHAWALGCNLAASGDWLVAGRSATFAVNFVDRGFSVDSGGSWLLPRIIGLNRAKQMLLGGQPVDALTAHGWGLVTTLVDDDEVDQAARRVADRLAAGATIAIGETKLATHRHAGVPLAAALEQEALAVELTIRSRDFREGIAAMAERREPQFEGR